MTTLIEEPQVSPQYLELLLAQEWVQRNYYVSGMETTSLGTVYTSTRGDRHVFVLSRFPFAQVMS